MTPSQSRSLAGLLLALAIVAGVWASDLRQSNAALAQTVGMLEAQGRRLTQPAATRAPGVATAASASATVAQATPALAALDPAAAPRLHQAAAGYGSDARNMAAALQRLKAWCTGAGLMECVVRRSTLASAASARATPAGMAASAGVARPELSPYAVALVATFNAKGAQALQDKLASGGFLYRVERVSIVQNRAEWDVVFFHDSGLRPEAADMLPTTTATPGR